MRGARAAAVGAILLVGALGAAPDHKTPGAVFVLHQDEGGTTLFKVDLATLRVEKRRAVAGGSMGGVVVPPGDELVVHTRARTKVAGKDADLETLDRFVTADLAPRGRTTLDGVAPGVEAQLLVSPAAPGRVAAFRRGAPTPEDEPDIMRRRGPQPSPLATLQWLDTAAGPARTMRLPDDCLVAGLGRVGNDETPSAITVKGLGVWKTREGAAPVRVGQVPAVHETELRFLAVDGPRSTLHGVGQTGRRVTLDATTGAVTTGSFAIAGIGETHFVDGLRVARRGDAVLAYALAVHLARGHERARFVHLFDAHWKPTGVVTLAEGEGFAQDFTFVVTSSAAELIVLNHAGTLFRHRVPDGARIATAPGLIPPGHASLVGER